MPSYSANMGIASLSAITATIKRKTGGVTKALKEGFADAVRPREGFIRPSSVDLEQDIREAVDTIVSFRAEIVTGQTSDGTGIQAQKRKTARFESSFGGFEIF